MRPSTLLALTVAALTTTTALADDWTVTRLRGGVFVLTNGQWEQLHRGSVVSDDRVIKSDANSRATFVRELETVELGPETTAQIADAGDITTVYNHAGTVGVDAEARNVQHFAVHTPHLAAIVKGTAFAVQAGTTQSTVAVTRGTVEVSDSGYGGSVSLGAGQEVSSSAERPITPAAVTPVSGNIPAPPPPVVPRPAPPPGTPVYIPGVTAPPPSDGSASSLGDSDSADRDESSGGTPPQDFPLPPPPQPQPPQPPQPQPQPPQPEPQPQPPEPEPEPPQPEPPQPQPPQPPPPQPEPPQPQPELPQPEPEPEPEPTPDEPEPQEPEPEPDPDEEGDEDDEDGEEGD